MLLMPVNLMQPLTLAGQVAATWAMKRRIQQQQQGQAGFNFQSSLVEVLLAVCTKALGKESQQLSRQGLRVAVLDRIE